MSMARCLHDMGYGVGRARVMECWSVHPMNGECGGLAGKRLKITRFSQCEHSCKLQQKCGSAQHPSSSLLSTLRNNAMNYSNWIWFMLANKLRGRKVWEWNPICEVSSMAACRTKSHKSLPVDRMHVYWMLFGHQPASHTHTHTLTQRLSIANSVCESVLAWCTECGDDMARNKQWRHRLLNI